MKKKEKDVIQEIKEKKKLPKEIKEKMNEVVFKNVALGIIIVLYFIFINLGYYNITKNVFIVDIKVFSVSLIIIAIALFEKAYQKGSSELAIYGIEMIFASFATLFMQYVYFYEDSTFIKLYMQIPLLFAIYYVIKSTILSAKIQNNYSSNISDVKEIVKKEKRTIPEEPTEDKDNMPEKVETIKEIKSEKKPKQTRKTKTSTEKTTKTKRTTTTKKTSTTKPKTSTTKTKSTTTKKTTSQSSKPRTTKTNKTEENK